MQILTFYLLITRVLNMSKTKILCILDGFGIGPDSVNNAITRANMPNFRRLLREYYWTTLDADGESVGQEAGLVGNSEVGHMNIGGLQLVPQLSYQITKSAEQGFSLETKDRLFCPGEYLREKWSVNVPLSRGCHGVAEVAFCDNKIENRVAHGSGRLNIFGRNSYNSNLIERAKVMAKNMTKAEKRIWFEVLSSKKTGYKFTKQEVVDSYILDFYCSELMLGVEVDGEEHGEKLDYDKHRTEVLNSFGIKIIRFTNKEVYENLEEVRFSIMLEVNLSNKFATSAISLYPLNRVANSVNHLSYPVPSEQPLDRGTYTAELVSLTATSPTEGNSHHPKSDFESNSYPVPSEQPLDRGTNTIHLIGLFSTGTIHSDMRHWIGSIEAAGRAGAEHIILHLITDGRDSDRKSLVATWDLFVTRFETRMCPFVSKIFLGSVGGRFYAMDRDKNWERGLVQITPWFSLFAKLNNFSIPDFIKNKYGSNVLEKTDLLMQKLTTELKEILLTGAEKDNLAKLSSTRVLNILQNGTNIKLSGIKDFLEDYTVLNYYNEVFDETLIPACLSQIKKNDTIWLINFRSDRMKQLTTLLCDINEEFGLNLDILAMNDYGIGREILKSSEAYASTPLTRGYYQPIFQTNKVENTLAETISNQNKTQLHIAETEKYAHVTYFLNGGKQEKHIGEDWHLIDSNKVDSHAEKPKMKAEEITDYILGCLESITPCQRGQSGSDGGFSSNDTNHILGESNPLSKGLNSESLGDSKQLFFNETIPYNRDLNQSARELRNNQTKAELLIWNNILKEDKTGYRFLRQKPLLKYIVDFYCYELGLVIEIDGDSHNYSLNYDQKRTRELEKLGLTVLRLRNEQVYSNLKGVCLEIKKQMTAIQNSLNPPNPTDLTPLTRGYAEFNLDQKKEPLWSSANFINNSQNTLKNTFQSPETKVSTPLTRGNLPLHNGNSFNYIIVNYANPDMVAHTGLIPESIASMEFLDSQLGRLLEVVERDGHSLIITADHGNCEFVGPFVKKTFSFSEELKKNLEGEQNLTDTEHNPNSVPCIIVDPRFKLDSNELQSLDVVSFFDNEGVPSQAENDGVFDFSALALDKNKLQKVLSQKNYKLLQNDEWLSQEQINELKKDQLPLWYVGVLLLML